MARLGLDLLSSSAMPYTCPGGIAGRLHAIRLRHRFQASQSQRLLHHSQVPTFPSNIDPDHPVRQWQNAVAAERSHRPRRASKVLEISDRFWHPRKVPWEYNRFQIAEARGEVDLGDVPVIKKQRNSGFQGKLEYQLLDTIYKSLQSQDPHQLMTALLTVLRLNTDAAGKALSSIPPITFSEILKCLVPHHFLGRYMRLQQELGPNHGAKLGMEPLGTGHTQAPYLFVGHLRTMMLRRRQKFSIADYRYLLLCARDAGKHRTAEMLWQAMLRDGVTPDTICYNHYLATKTFEYMFHARQRHSRLRTPFAVARRQLLLRDRSHSGHKLGDGGIKTTTIQIFRSMMSQGLTGNEETFCLMLSALAREGDLDGVKAVLKKVWGIDVDAVMTSVDEEPNVTVFHAPSSPFYPSSKLLQTVAHLYGINGEIPIALRLVDYISRQFGLSIPRDTCFELLNFAYVQSTKLRQNERRGNRLPPRVVQTLWASLTSQPYGMRPDMQLYNFYISRLISSHAYGGAQSALEEAKEQNDKVLRLYKQARYRFLRELRLSRGVLNSPLQKLRRDHLFYAVKVRRNRQYFQSWLRNIMWQGSRNMWPDFMYKQIPQMMEDYELLVPTFVKYRVASGVVEFDPITNGAPDGVEYHW